VCEAAADVAVVKLLLREVLRVRMPSLLGGCGRFRLGEESRGDGVSTTFMLISSARWSDSSTSVTFVFLVYFFSKMRRTVMVMVNM
jgi:hypothetical protein